MNSKYQDHTVEEFELSDRLYSVSDIEEYFEYIIEKHEKTFVNSTYQSTLLL